MELIEQIKQEKDDVAYNIHFKFLEALKALEPVENGEKQVYVNGESEEVREYCLQERSKVRVKKAER